MDWDTATDTSMTPRATTPVTAVPDDVAPEAMDLNEGEDAREEVSHVEIQTAAFDPSKDQTESEDSGSELPRQAREESPAFTRLKARFEILVADLEGGKYIDSDRLDLYDYFISSYKPSSTSEENFLAVFEEVLNHAKTRKRLADQARRMENDISLADFARTRRKIPGTRWACCGCGAKGWMFVIDVGCPLCGHRRCLRCRVTAFSQSRLENMENSFPREYQMS